MKGKRFPAFFLPAALALSAFSQSAAPRPDLKPDVLFQFLTVVDADGSAEFHYNLKYSAAQVADDLKTGGYSEEEVCAKTTSQLENNIGAFKQEKHGEEIWCTYAMTFDNLQGLSNHLKKSFSVAVNRMEIEESRFYLDLTWSSLPCNTDDPAKFSCEWAVRAPGAVGKHNATRLDGNTLLWDMSASGAVHHYTAESAVGGTDPTVVILVVILLGGCCCTVLLIAVGVGVFLFLRRKNAAGETAEPAAEQTPAPSPADMIKR